MQELSWEEKYDLHTQEELNELCKNCLECKQFFDCDIMGDYLDCPYNYIPQK